MKKDDSIIWDGTNMYDVFTFVDEKGDCIGFKDDATVSVEAENGYYVVNIGEKIYRSENGNIYADSKLIENI